MVVWVLLLAVVAATPLCDDGDHFVCPTPRDGGTRCCHLTSPSGIPPDLVNCGGDRPTGLPFATRSPVLARNGAAACSQPLSTQTAIRILQQGGSAVDAAVAANAVEGVVEPMMNGMGGDLMAIVYDGVKRKVFGYNGSGRAPRGQTLDQLKAALKGKRYIPLKGPLAVSVPGAVDGWCQLHKKFGKLPWGDVLRPAITYATEGYAVSEVIAAEWHESVESIKASANEITSGGKYPHALDNFLHTYTINGSAPKAGQVFKNPDLARTLTAVAEGGCEAFYNGSVAATMAAYAPTVGLPLRADDFALHNGEEVVPSTATYRGSYEVYELPPNPQGIAALQMLNILEGYDLRSMGHNSADYLHVHVEAKKLAFADRAKYYADPNFVHVPVEGLISKDYANERRKLINMTHAAQRVDAGTPAGHDTPWSGDTMYLTTADSNGTMVSLIQSLYTGFGSGLVPTGLGFALQDRGALFNTDGAAADVYAPGKRPFHTIIPGFVKKDGEPWLSFGVMGGNMQPQGHAQILANIIDHGMNVQEAGDAARYYHTGSSQPMGQIMTDGGVLELEGGVCDATREELRKRGHHIVAAPNGGGYQAIMRDEFGTYHAASEMRKDGHAAGY